MRGMDMARNDTKKAVAHQGQYLIGEVVDINVGTLAAPRWLPSAEIVWVHPFGSHVHAKIIVHVDSVRKHVVPG
jgi:hypothetical protein